MASGTIYGTTSNQYVDSKIKWWSITDNAKNESTVTAELYYKRNNTNHLTTGYGDFTLSIDGQTEKNANRFISIKDSWYIAVSATKTISHNADGTKTITISAEGSIPGTDLESTYCSGTVELDIIPKASTITKAPDTNFGDYASITWTPQTENLYYKIRLALGTWSETSTAIYPNTTNEHTSTILLRYEGLAENFPIDSRTAQVTAELYTYLENKDSNGDGTLVGVSSKTFKVVISSSSETFEPEVRRVFKYETPFEKLASCFLQGITKIKGEISASAKYGASIVKCGVKVGGQEYVSEGDTLEFTSDVFNTEGALSLYYYAADSREIYFSNTVYPTVLKYEAPYISPGSGEVKVICERCEEDGTASETGTYLHVKGTRNYTKINQGSVVNTCSVICKYKAGGTEKFKEITLLSNADTSTDEFDDILDINLDPTLIYKVELEIVDDTDIPRITEFYIPSEYVDFEFRSGGKGFALGKHATKENAFDCNWDARFFKNVYINDYKILDFVVEQSTEDNWYCRKWYSGKAECWGRRAVKVEIATECGAIYQGSVERYNFPSQLFSSAPVCQMTIEGGTADTTFWLAAKGNEETDAESAPAAFICSPTTQTASFDILYYAIGNWNKT